MVNFFFPLGGDVRKIYEILMRIRLSIVRDEARVATSISRAPEVAVVLIADRLKDIVV